MLKKIQGLIKAVFSKEYAKASIYYVFANIIGQGIVLLSSAIFTRMMSKNDYGLVNTYSTWVLVINTFICLNLFITVRNAYIDYHKDYDRFVSSVLLLNILLGLAITAVIVGITVLCGLSFSLEEVLLACLQSVSLNIVNYVMAQQAMKNEYRKRAVFMVAPNWTHILLSIVLMLIFTKNLYLSKIAGNAFGMAIFGVMGCIYIFRKAAPKIVSEYWRYALKISIPSIFHTISDLILIQCDRLMLTAMVGAEYTGEYSVIYTACSIIAALYMAINGAWTPWFFATASKNDKEAVRKLHKIYLLGFSVLTCGMLTISPELIKVISPKDYWSGISYISPLIIASYLMFLIAFYSGYLLFQKKTGIIARNALIAAILNLLINYALIPKYKSLGAVAATLVSYIVLFLISYFSVGKEGHSFFSECTLWECIGVILMYGVGTYLFRDMWVLRYGILVCFLVAFYMLIGKKIVKEFCK